MDSDDSDVQEIDIENLLDEGLPDDLRERKKMHNYEERSKMVLEGKIKSTAKFLTIIEYASKLKHVFCPAQKKVRIISKFYQKDGSR